jgi:hypothetical protein
MYAWESVTSRDMCFAEDDCLFASCCICIHRAHLLHLCLSCTYPLCVTPISPAPPLSVRPWRPRRAPCWASGSSRAGAQLPRACATPSRTTRTTGGTPRDRRSSLRRARKHLRQRRAKHARRGRQPHARRARRSAARSRHPYQTRPRRTRLSSARTRTRRARSAHRRRRPCARRPPRSRPRMRARAARTARGCSHRRGPRSARRTCPAWPAGLARASCARSSRSRARTRARQRSPRTSRLGPEPH